MHMQRRAVDVRCLLLTLLACSSAEGKKAAKKAKAKKAKLVFGERSEAERAAWIASVGQHAAEGVREAGAELHRLEMGTKACAPPGCGGGMAAGGAGRKGGGGREEEEGGAGPRACQRL